MSKPLLRVEDLAVHFKAGGGLGRKARLVRAVNGVSFELMPGETLGYTDDQKLTITAVEGSFVDGHALRIGLP